ncbi:MAG: tRNA uridine-5-carboxymethylaminomethyl(34) synthesis GTPase MnmE [Gemmatimonadetes bacterium]|nr:tRNA uridine-5-carboxymethylaminomethyl(34) synthesis GTPase MnmE [Gemmatimonadota bacterium]
MDVDTIVAQATPPGLGGLAVVRLSGPNALRVLTELTPGGTAPREPRRVELRHIFDPVDGTLIDRALVTFFAGPSSYTGEDVVEISCHGGWITPRLVVEACVRSGAREAEAGEFTRRAHLRGKLDLVQAEAVADLIEARSGALRDAAVHQLERGLSERVSALRERLLRVEALLAHHVDFPEEDDAPVSMDAVLAEADTLAVDMATMLRTAPEGELLREGALTVFAGRPNVGKSSLFNALVGAERAIVTEEAGTTRDALEAAVQIGGFPFRLVDTAGMRRPAGRVEELGIEFARRYLERADLVLYCVEAGTALDGEERQFLEECAAPVVVLETKCDTLEGGETRADQAKGADAPSAGSSSPVAERLRLSVETGEGLGELRDMLPSLVYSAVVQSDPGTPVLTRRRHARALESAASEIVGFREAIEEGLPAEVAATHLRSAEMALEELLGVVTTDDVLDVVFREFCIGK